MPPESFTTTTQLPIHAYRQNILDAIDANQVTIITAETGAGKSTQVPQYLAEHGYAKVIVTQPRILAARNLSDRVRQEYSWRQSTDCSHLVGFRTAHERDDGPDTVILYCTDGLQLVRELTGSGTVERQILILDEVHEWNENMEVLVAWAKKRCQEDPSFKVVLMSATMDSVSLAEYYQAQPPILIPGRSFLVAERYSQDLIGELTELIKIGGSNTLVFLPGKAEIEHVSEVLRPYAGSVPLIPLHSQLEPAMQQLAFAHYPQGKIVLSTNIAQTSVTIDDIDIVVDSGLERRAEVRSGVEGLFIEQTSQSDCLQRAGRAGRTKPGTYILAKLGTLPCAPVSERPDYGIPEILRKHIDRLVLRLATIDIDIEDLDFYHAPSHKTVKYAKQTLKSLGAMTANQTVTDIGHDMERFPIESSYARMLVESRRYDPAVQAKLAAIIAIQEVGGIVKGGPRYSGWRRYCHQSQSDLVAQYEVYLELDTINPLSYEEFGIIAKNADKADEIIERLLHDLGVSRPTNSVISETELPLVLQCIVAGQLHQLWSRDSDNQAVHLGSQKRREISSTSVVKQATLFAGTPFDLEIPTAQGLETLHLVNQLTVVEPQWLVELAPDRYKTRPGKIYFNPVNGTLASKTVLQFDAQSYETSSSPLLERTNENKQLFNQLYGQWVHEQLDKERTKLQSINSKRIPDVSLKQIRHQLQYALEDAVSLFELSKPQRAQVAKLCKLETYLGTRFMTQINLVGKQRHSQGMGQRRPWKVNPKKHYNRRQQ